MICQLQNLVARFIQRKGWNLEGVAQAIDPLEQIRVETEQALANYAKQEANIKEDMDRFEKQLVVVQSKIARCQRALFAHEEPANNAAPDISQPMKAN